MVLLVGVGERLARLALVARWLAAARPPGLGAQATSIWERHVGDLLLRWLAGVGPWSGHAAAAVRLSCAAAQEWALTLAPLMAWLLLALQAAAHAALLLLRTLGWRQLLLWTLLLIGVLGVLWLLHQTVQLVAQALTRAWQALRRRISGGRRAVRRGSRAWGEHVRQARARSLATADYILTKGLPQTLFMACAVCLLAASRNVPPGRLQPLVDAIDLACRLLAWLYCLRRIATWGPPFGSSPQAKREVQPSLCEWEELLELEEDRHCLSLAATVVLVEAAFALPLAGPLMRLLLGRISPLSNLVLVRCIFRLWLVLPMTRGDKAVLGLLSYLLTDPARREEEREAQQKLQGFRRRATVEQSRRPGGNRDSQGVDKRRPREGTTVAYRRSGANHTASRSGDAAALVGRRPAPPPKPAATAWFSLKRQWWINRVLLGESVQRLGEELWPFAFGSVFLLTPSFVARFGCSLIGLWLAVLPTLRALGVHYRPLVHLAEAQQASHNHAATSGGWYAWLWGWASYRRGAPRDGSASLSKIVDRDSQLARQWLCYWVALPCVNLAVALVWARVGILPLRYNVQIAVLLWLRVGGCRGAQLLCSRLIFLQRFAPAILSAMLLKVLGPTGPQQDSGGATQGAGLAHGPLGAQVPKQADGAAQDTEDTGESSPISTREGQARNDQSKGTESPGAASSGTQPPHRHAKAA